VVLIDKLFTVTVLRRSRAGPARIRCIVPSTNGGGQLLISTGSKFVLAPTTTLNDMTQPHTVTPPQSTFNGRTIRGLNRALSVGVVNCPDLIFQTDPSDVVARAWGVSEAPRWRYSFAGNTFNASRHEDPHRALASGKPAAAWLRLRGACLSLDPASIRVLVHAGVSWSNPVQGWWAPTELLRRNPSARLMWPGQVRQEWAKALDCPVPTAWRPLMMEALNVFLEYAGHHSKSASTASSSSHETISPWRILHVRVRVLRDAMVASEPLRVLRQMSGTDIRNVPLGRVIAKHCPAASELSTWSWHPALALRTALWAYHTGLSERVSALLALVPSSAQNVIRSVPRSELQWLWLPVSTTSLQSTATAATDWAVVRLLLHACIASVRLVDTPECLSFLASDAGCMDILIGESPHASRLVRSRASSSAAIPLAISSAVSAACERRLSTLSPLFVPELAQLIMQYAT
jgi:hypothetical protein